MKKSCGHGCRYKCNFKYSEKDREGIGDINRQRNFPSKYAAQKKGTAGRERAMTWFYPNPKESNVSEKVCKTFFLATLGFSERMVFTVLDKQSSIGVCETDKRGKHNSRPNETTDDKKTKARSHIESFPTVESHYCRKHSNRQYLSPDLSIMRMYTSYESYIKRMTQSQ